jgi:hypothetical protein
MQAQGIVLFGLVIGITFSSRSRPAKTHQQCNAKGKKYLFHGPDDALFRVDIQ